MEPTHKNNDCYFFYYSTCTKGDNCAFRHEPSALGCESMCQYWQQGNCLNEHCNFRHMELKKNRKSIPCFWESQRGGCKKPHCPFLHTSGRVPPNADPANPIKTAEVTSKPVTQEWSNRPDDGKYDGSGTESDQGRGSSEAGSFIGSPAVDPLIVNFDEGTLSLPSSLQTSLNLRNTLSIRNGISIPVDIPSSLNISGGTTSGVPAPVGGPTLSVAQQTGVQNLQTNQCHHVATQQQQQQQQQQHQYAHQANYHHHHAHTHAHGQTMAAAAAAAAVALQSQASTSTQIHQRSPYNPSSLNAEQSPQAQRSRFPFPFLGFSSYRRY